MRTVRVSSSNLPPDHLGDLSKFFHPASIAVVGASSDPKTISGQPLAYLQQHGYAGQLYPVNPKHERVAGIRCYPDIRSLPEIPELAMFVVAARRAIDALREFGEMGGRQAVVISSGFAEAGPEGACLQDQLVEVARRYGIAVLGPNAQGFISTPNHVYAGFGGVFGHNYKSGSLSLVTQSGGFGFAVASMTEEAGVGLRHVISSGNEAVLNTIDLIDCLLDDAGTEVISAYVEGLKDAKRLVGVGRKALSKKKPILIWKAGTTDEGARAAASHTANMGGANALYEATFRQAGILRIHDAADLVDYARAFQLGKYPSGKRVGVITLSGGAGILITDELIANGCEVPSLSAATAEKLQEILPSFVVLNNPIDVTAGIFDRDDMLARTLDVMLADPCCDSLAIMLTSLGGELAVRAAHTVAAACKSHDKPIFVYTSVRRASAQEAYAVYEANRIPVFPTPVRCGKSLAALVTFSAAMAHEQLVSPDPPAVVMHPAGRPRLATRRSDLAEYEAKEVLAACGIPVTRERVAASAEEAARLAAEIGFPVALKVQSPDIPHKTEAGGVMLNVRDVHDVVRGYHAVTANARRYAPLATVDGVLVQEMLGAGTEVILGATNDAQFGTVVMIGSGGIFAEVLNDATFELAPVSRTQALEMIRRIRGYALLAGARGRPPADVDALADAIQRLSEIVVTFEDRIAEIEINPMVVFERGQGVRAADALIKLKPHASSWKRISGSGDDCREGEA